ncbi:MAG: hypothetical protein DRO93_00860 [Candidatus Thorarchaeota archaeon]|nr:MAG: hypothetical protein DRO93_00860 [Candidatus Thorarchaeota archaeon]
MRKRMTAIRCEVADIVNGSYDNEDGPRVLSPYGVEMRRVVLVGFVVDQYVSEGFASITIDDSTGTIRAKGWGSDASALSSIQLGSLVLMIGKVREYEGERYIVPEIIRAVTNSNYLILHKLERLRTLLERSGVTGIEAPEESIAPESEAGLVVAAPLPADESPATAQGTEDGASSTTSTTGPLGQQIIHFIRARGGPVSNDEILEHFTANGFDRNEITLKILDLLDDGTIIEDPIGVYRCQ